MTGPERNPTRTRLSIQVAAARAGVHPSTLRRYVQLGLVATPLSGENLAQVRRIRRLSELGINLAGIEIILRMRQQIDDLVSRIQQLEEQAELTSVEEEGRTVEWIEYVEGYWWEP